MYVIRFVIRFVYLLFLFMCYTLSVCFLAIVRHQFYLLATVLLILISFISCYAVSSDLICLLALLYVISFVYLLY